MAKAKVKKAAKVHDPRTTATISYHPGADAQKIEVAVPLRPGQGEAIINTAERAFANVEHVRAQVRKLPHA